MNNRTKGILVGVGAAIAVGLTAYFLSSDDAQEKTEAMMNRHKAKSFVKDKLHGNKKAMSVVDQLSDEEVNHLLSTVNRVSDLEGKISDYSDQLKSVSTDFKDMVMAKTESVKNKVTH